MKKRILFVSHEASRTGAPIVLCNIVRWLKLTDEFDITIFLKSGGEIEGEFRALAPTFIKSRGSLIKRVAIRILKRFGMFNTYTLPRKLRNKKFDLVYINTVATLDIAKLLKDTFRCPLLCHVHEMAFTITYYYKKLVDERNLKYVDHFIAVSQKTKQNLSVTHGINEDKITLIYETIEIDKAGNPTIQPELIRSLLGVEEHCVVGGSGLSSWRKGIDLFIQLAITINRLIPDNNFKFVWVGNINVEFQCQFDYQNSLHSFKKNVILLGSKSDPQNYFQIFDIFALTSREDPFPLVALEAASQAKPIVCFSSTGGISDFAASENGIIDVPYEDVRAMCDELIKLKNDLPLKRTLGQNAFRFAQGFDVGIQCKQIKQVIETML